MNCFQKENIFDERHYGLRQNLAIFKVTKDLFNIRTFNTNESIQCPSWKKTFQTLHHNILSHKLGKYDLWENYRLRFKSYKSMGYTEGQVQKAFTKVTFKGMIKGKPF